MSNAQQKRIDLLVSSDAVATVVVGTSRVVDGLLADVSRPTPDAPALPRGFVDQDWDGLS